jgi:hypothetical protein
VRRPRRSRRCTTTPSSGELSAPADTEAQVHSSEGYLWGYDGGRGSAQAVVEAGRYTPLGSDTDVVVGGTFDATVAAWREADADADVAFVGPERGPDSEALVGASELDDGPPLGVLGDDEAAFLTPDGLAFEGEGAGPPEPSRVTDRVEDLLADVDREGSALDPGAVEFD